MIQNTARLRRPQRGVATLEASACALARAGARKRSSIAYLPLPIFEPTSFAMPPRRARPARAPAAQPPPTALGRPTFFANVTAPPSPDDLVAYSEWERALLLNLWPASTGKLLPTEELAERHRNTTAEILRTVESLSRAAYFDIPGHTMESLWAEAGDERRLDAMVRGAASPADMGPNLRSRDEELEGPG